ncbi:hypothetical protein IMG5_024730 [Ichthyophthirius multifiliis]|uniref:Transmembrane protein n=1 Tax=Ichthyophthirius multifiliis TaxID=5932 RepID=G0QL37_ICHMU|nr:hypothetical protein IMG5_024730 [Ichthyophthirius multifiliis]EGR34070.1 hypothetical protein IMG5_024730 [Ichthyophthirius multifiliis]|eukprot:XP_004039374.1 hypothetical protein IMG5_024730 [Ichthyophthirius multifiliis]
MLGNTKQIKKEQYQEDQKTYFKKQSMIINFHILYKQDAYKYIWKCYKIYQIRKISKLELENLQKMEFLQQEQIGQQLKRRKKRYNQSNILKKIVQQHLQLILQYNIIPALLIFLLVMKILLMISNQQRQFYVWQIQQDLKEQKNQNPQEKDQTRPKPQIAVQVLWENVYKPQVIINVFLFLLENPNLQDYYKIHQVEIRKQVQLLLQGLPLNILMRLFLHFLLDKGL